MGSPRAGQGGGPVTVTILLYSVVLSCRTTTTPPCFYAGPPESVPPTSDKLQSPTLAVNLSCLKPQCGILLFLTSRLNSFTWSTSICTALPLPTRTWLSSCAQARSDPSTRVFLQSWETTLLPPHTGFIHAVPYKILC